MKSSMKCILLTTTIILLTPFFSHADSDEVLSLAKTSGCFACHSIEKKIVGPAWADVSSRYKKDESARATLISKIKTGGKGNWTEITGGVPMPPYSPRVGDENIEKLVDFILGLSQS